MANVPPGTRAIPGWSAPTTSASSTAGAPASPDPDDASSVPRVGCCWVMASDPRRSTQREILPVPDITPPGLVTYDAKDPDSSFPPIVEPQPPAGAPNVLVVLIDDAGFGSSSAFGGPCATPNAERLAATG